MPFLSLSLSLSLLFIFHLMSFQTISVCCTALLQRTVWWPCLSLWGRVSTFSWVGLSPLRTSGLERKNWILKWARVQVRELFNELLVLNILLWESCFNYIILFFTIRCTPVFYIWISEIITRSSTLSTSAFILLLAWAAWHVHSFYSQWLLLLLFHGCLHLLSINLFLLLYILPSITVPL